LSDDEEISDKPRRRGLGRGPLLFVNSAAPIEGDPSRPQRDRHNRGVVWWFGKKLYLGGDNTHVRRLFNLLAYPVGRSHTLADIKRELDGFEADRTLGYAQAEVKRADDRLRKSG
jgi:hypothetical protein